MRINIKKAKLTNKGTLEVHYTDEDGNELTMKGANRVHRDLKNRLNALVPFMAEITEQKEANSIDWINIGGAENTELLRFLDVTGVCVNDSEENPFATLIGRRTLLTKKVLNIIVPATGLTSDNESYERVTDFNDAVEAFLYEAELYVTQQKYADEQTQIDFSQAADDAFEGATPEEGVEQVTGEAVCEPPANEAA